MSIQDRFPYLSEAHARTYQSLKRVFGDNEAEVMLVGAGSPESQMALLNAFAAFGSNASERPVKLPVPKFEGKEGENLPRWLIKVGKAADAQMIRSDQMRIDFALSHLSGRAEEWAYTNCMAQATPFSSYEDFVAQLRQMFLPPHSDFRYRSLFLAAKQGGRSLFEYVQELRYFVACLVDPMPESTKVTVFMKGLRPSTGRTQLFRVYPRTLEEAINIAISEDYSQSQSRQGMPSSPSGARDPSDMEICATDISEIRCYNCDQKGHYANKCSAPKREREQGRDRDRYRGPGRKPGRGFFRPHQGGGRGYQGNAKSQ
jgi:hypothetical protein